MVARAASIRSRDPASAPPITSLWPARALVRLCITRSAPRASGRWRNGVAKVLSTTTTRPRACAAAHTAARSTISSPGLVGLSTISTRLRSPATRSTRARSAAPTKRAVDAEARQQVGEQPHRPAVERRARQHLVAGANERGHRGRHRRHAGRERERRLGALDRGERLLELADGGVRVARVEEELLVALEIAAHLGRGAEGEGGGLHDGRASGPGRASCRPCTAVVPGPRSLNPSLPRGRA